jgi:uncharacterized protein (DUF1330 family)
MPAYAVAHLRKVALGPAIIAYLEQIDATLAPFGGRCLVHGGETTLLEGSWAGDLIVIAFPDRAAALGWYQSAAYQRILALRTDHAEGNVIIVDGVPPDHRATDILARQRLLAHNRPTLHCSDGSWPAGEEEGDDGPT